MVHGPVFLPCLGNMARLAQYLKVIRIIGPAGRQWHLVITFQFCTAPALPALVPVTVQYGQAHLAPLPWCDFPMVPAHITVNSSKGLDLIVSPRPAAITAADSASIRAFLAALSRAGLPAPS